MFAWRQLLLAIVLVSASRVSAGEVPFTHAGIMSLKGKDICSLQGDFPKTDGVFLDRHKEHAVKTLDRNGVLALFLLSKPLSDNCGVVDDVLDLTPLVKEGETLEFKCYTDKEGGTTWRKWGHIVGLANNQQGKKRFVRARLAWRTNTKQKRFEPIRNKTVRCDTSGYAE